MNNEIFWIYDKLEYQGKLYPYEAKVYKNPSKFGIRNGRVSKLFVYDVSLNILWSYDRGEDNDLPEFIIDHIMKKFPEILK